jgi:hypothetical protein
VPFERDEPFQILLDAGGSDLARLQRAAELVEEEWQFFALIDFSVPPQLSVVWAKSL